MRAAVLPIFGMDEISVITGLQSLWGSDAALALLVTFLAVFAVVTRERLGRLVAVDRVAEPFDAGDVLLGAEHEVVAGRAPGRLFGHVDVGQAVDDPVGQMDHVAEHE